MNIVRKFSSLCRQDDDSDCILWIGPHNKDGYGKFSYELPGKSIVMLAHTFAYILHYKKEPKFEIHHKCLTRNCVNGSHLEDLTKFEHEKQHFKQFCKRGHDTIIVGRFKSGNCKACDKERKRNGTRQTVAVSTVTS